MAVTDGKLRIFARLVSDKPGHVMTGCPCTLAALLLSMFRGNLLALPIKDVPRGSLPIRLSIPRPLDGLKTLKPIAAHWLLFVQKAMPESPTTRERDAGGLP